jgi:hypothetical protein
MTSAALTAKAHRLLTAGRVAVVSADAETLVADVQGDHAGYRVVVIHGGPICSCPARRLCAHGLAVALVAGVRVGPAYRRIEPWAEVKGCCQVSRHKSALSTNLRVIPKTLSTEATR